MSGTGDVDCLRLMRELRWKVEGEVTYGNHMALNMALGLLFLGNTARQICVPVDSDEAYLSVQAVAQLL